MVERLYVVILTASVFEISCGKTDKQTDRRRWKPYTPATAYVVGNYRWWDASNCDDRPV